MTDDLYTRLKAYGHSPATALEIVIDVDRGLPYAVEWAELAKGAQQMTDVERVARAIRDSIDDDCAITPMEAEKVARAAIAAMQPQPAHDKPCPNPGSKITRMLEEIEAQRAAMDPADRGALEAAELIAQRESWVRAMAPCEHGDPDWETCPECRGWSKP